MEHPLINDLINEVGERLFSHINIDDHVTDITWSDTDNDTCCVTVPQDRSLITQRLCSNAIVVYDPLGTHSIIVVAYEPGVYRWFLLNAPGTDVYYQWRHGWYPHYSQGSYPTDQQMLEHLYRS